MTHKMDLTGRLLIVLAVISLLALVFNVWGLYFFTKFVSSSTSTFGSIFKIIWLPALPLLIVWLLAVVFGIMRWRFITLILLVSSYWIIKHSVYNILHISGVSGFEYWISYLASWLALVAAFLNLIILLIWVLRILVKS